MARILCGVDQCSHNKTGECYSNFVSIAGSSAQKECDTSCSSFLNKTIYSELTNNTIHGGACDSLDCKVETCKYNDAYKCNLDNIQVNGINADSYDETSCSSFESK
ncbi:DUF1540 domain-containing protein [Anaerosinus massiliensis]|uniref:DUF1540 domain-containing protein n=1 Tax=Massilibacillus massiliensis TaxID=1806837 RepID=UPI000DA63017|nr:DUF1540 domain-containing protein [Massilibacillus massiliensis]